MDLEQQTAEQIKRIFTGGNLPKALQLAQQNLREWPNNVVLQKVQAYCLFQLGHYQEATVCFHQIESRYNKDQAILANLGSSYFHLHYFDKAAKYFIKALVLEFNVEWVVNLGNCYSELGLHELAIITLQRALKAGAKDAKIVENFIHNLMLASRFNHALSVVNSLPDCQLKSILKTEINVALNQPERVEKNLALELENQTLDIPILRRLHNVYRHLGNKEKELATIRELLERDPESALLSKCMLAAAGELDTQSVEQELATTAQDNQAKARCYFILANAYKTTAPKKWFETIQKANQLQAEQKPEMKLYQQVFSLVEQSARDIPAISDVDLEKGKQKNITPIFILGMPRSGTTLVETLLGNHSNVFAAGETTLMDSLAATIHAGIPDVIQGHAMRTFHLKDKSKLTQTDLGQFATSYLESLSQYRGTEQFVTDKMPHNFLHLGLILKSFPNAKIIHCKRDPISTCISVYEQNFSQFHDYGRDLETLGEYYLMYDKLMQFFKQQDINNQILEVQYEELVQDPQQGMQNILEFVGLEQQDVINNSKRRTILTSSNEQATQGVYNSSINRLDGLEEEFAPLVKKLSEIYH